MRIHAERAREFLGTRSLEEFLADEMVQTAVVRCVEVVGEPARQVSPTTRDQAPGIQWSRIIEMRNVLAHDYGAVDYERVFTVVREELPDLIDRICELISFLERNVGWQEDGGGE